MNDTQRRQADISAGGWVLSVGLAGVAIMLAFAGLWLPNGRAGPRSATQTTGGRILAGRATWGIPGSVNNAGIIGTSGAAGVVAL